MIKESWSPDSISGTYKEKWEIMVCRQTIYNYIREQEPSLAKSLKYKKGYKPRGQKETRGQQKTNFKLITERDSEVENRRRIGDTEVDMVVSSWGNRKGWIVTIVDRMSKFLAAERVSQKRSDLVWDVLIRVHKNVRKEKLFTITADNGKEFFDFERVESETWALFYFAHPYASYERGTNEQTNGMIRVFFPKWTDFSKISDQELQTVVEKINKKPRKSLWYKSAWEVFHNVILPL